MTAPTRPIEPGEIVRYEGATYQVLVVTTHDRIDGTTERWLTLYGHWYSTRAKSSFQILERYVEPTDRRIHPDPRPTAQPREKVA